MAARLVHDLLMTEGRGGRRGALAPPAPCTTPLERLDLPAASAIPRVFVKREDAQPFALGGNKVRQTMPYVADALSRGATHVLVSGAVQSNFVRVVAAAAARAGLTCEAFLEDRVANRSSSYYETGNVLLGRLTGARVRVVQADADETVAVRRLERRAEALAREGAHPYVVATGPDDAPLGATGFVDAAYELARQYEAFEIEPTDLVVPTGTGYTQAGLVAGFRAAGLDGLRIHGIAVRRPARAQRERVASVARRTERLLGLAPGVRATDILVNDRFLGPSYGQLAHEVREAVRLGAGLGLYLDPVYSGRGFAGLLDLLGSLAPGRGPVVFVHTGGAPALFAYPEVATDDPLPRAEAGDPLPHREADTRFTGTHPAAPEEDLWNRRHDPRRPTTWHSNGSRIS